MLRLDSGDARPYFFGHYEGLTKWGATMTKICLAYIEPKVEPVLPSAVAALGTDEADYLERHVSALRDRANDADAQRSRFQPGADVPNLFKKLLSADDDTLVEITGIFATRLSNQMKVATNPNAGVLAIVITGGGEQTYVSVLKLDATHEAASFKQLAQGKVTITLLRRLLPSPGELQKGISWPDPRPTSDAVIRDRNIQAAQYFLNAFQLEVGAKASDTERDLLAAITSLPAAEVPKAFQLAATKTGPAETVVAELQTEHPSLEAIRPSLQPGPRAGIVRPNKIAARRIRLVAEGIEILVNPDYAGLVSWIAEGDGYVITVRVPTEPKWQAG